MNIFKLGTVMKIRELENIAKILVFCAATLSPLSFASSGSDAEDNKRGLEIANNASEIDDYYQDLVFDMTMIIRNSTGMALERELLAKTFEVDGDGNKTLLIFRSPKDQKGTILLTHTHKYEHDDQMIYLPALKRVKRIASTNKSGPFVGSEFAYEDITPQEVEKYTYKYIRDEQYEDVNCHVVERTPLAESSGYSRQVVWYDEHELYIRKIDYYDRKNKLYKTLKYVGYRQYSDRYWRADSATMTNHRNDKSTELIAKNWKFKNGLDESQFSRNALQRTRIR